MARFQILSLDGGGIRGAFSASLLTKMEEMLGRPLVQSFDLIAGTSTGGILAAGLAAGLSAKELEDFYKNHGAKIFKPRPPMQAKGVRRPVYPVVRRVVSPRIGQSTDDFFRARYCPISLEEAFTLGMGGRTLGSVVKSRLIVPAVNLTQGCVKVFRTPHLPMGLQDRDESIVDVLLSTTAAPTYFPHKTLAGGDAYADGGLWAASPALLAFCEAMHIRQMCTREFCDQTYETSDISVLSIGTGQTMYSLTPPGSDAGMLYWARHVADVMMASQIQGVQSPLSFVLGDRYTHLDFDLTDSRWSLDSAEFIPEFCTIGAREGEAEFDRIAEAFFEHQATPYQPYDPDAQVPEGSTHLIPPA